MADAQKTIDLIFNGIDKTGAATQAALGNAQKFSSSLQNVTQPIAEFTVAAVKLEAGLLAAGLAMTVFAVKTAGDFDTSFRQITTLVDASAEDMGRFKDAILSYAEGSTQPLEKITSSLSAAIGSGVAWGESLGLIGVAEKLAVATRADLQGTTEVLVSTLNAYGMKTEDAGKVSDLFFQIIKDGKIEMNDLAHSLAMVTPSAAAAGVSLTEIGAAVATLTASGIQPATAIEYLRSAIVNIIKPSKQASDMAAELGIEFDANALKSKGLAAVLDDVAKATGGNTGKMAQLIGDVGGLTAAMVLTGPQAQKFKEAIESMGNSAGSVDVAFAKMGGSLDQSLAKVAGAFKVLLVSIGAPLLDEFGGVAAAIANIFTALAGSVKDGALKDLVGYIESVFGDIQGALETVAKNLPAALASADFGDFKEGIESVLNAMKSLFGSIDLTSVDGLKQAIETVGVAFLGLSRYTAGVIEVFKPLFDTLIAVGKGAKGVDLSFLEFAGNLSGIATQLNLVLPLFTTLLGILTVKSGLGLLSEFKDLVTILPTLATALTGAGVALAAYFAADKVIALVSALAQWKEANNHLAKSQQESAAISDKSALSLDRFAQTTGLVAKSLDEAIGMIDRGTVVWSTAANGWVKAGDAMADAGDAAKSSVGGFEKSNEAMLKNFAASEKAAAGNGKLADAQKSVTKYALETVPIFDALSGKITGYEQRLVASVKGTIDLGSASGKTAGDLGRIAAETDKAKESTRKWNEEVAKMAFEEKLKLIEQQTKIMTATIEADAKKTVAAFDSLTNSIKSTGDVLGKLFTNLDFSKIGWSEQRLITDQIDKENKLRQDAFNLQKRLIDAQVDQMKAQTDALLKGEGLIKIDGAGLQPHLEAFMWTILQAIQVKVNKDGLKMLLGV